MPWLVRRPSPPLVLHRQKRRTTIDPDRPRKGGLPDPKIEKPRHRNVLQTEPETRSGKRTGPPHSVLSIRGSPGPGLSRSRVTNAAAVARWAASLHVWGRLDARW